MTDKHSFATRQLEIVKLVAEGLCDKEIAQRLNLSPQHVKNLLQAIYRSHGVHSRVGLIRSFYKLEAKSA